MGFTHALSAVAVALLIIAFSPDVVTKTLGGDSLAVLALSILVVVGAALFPDADNTKSTFRSSLGFIGIFISEGVRAISKITQTLIRTKYDDANPDPHRGAFHSPFVAALLAIATWLLLAIGGEVKIPLLGEVSWGFTIGVGISWMFIHVALSGLFGKAMKKIKKSDALGEIVALFLSLGLTVILFSSVPENSPMIWLPVAMFLGMTIHDIGDAFTTSGAPLLAPIPIKGKIWYDVRIPPHIKAGGAAENYLFIPAFSILVLIAVAKISIDILNIGS